MTFGPLLAIFLTYYLLYGLLLTLFKHFRSTGFKLLSHGERCKEVVKLLFIPEVNEDCMSKKWKIDTLLLVVIQVVSNLILLVPFFVTGKKSFQSNACSINYLIEFDLVDTLLSQKTSLNDLVYFKFEKPQHMKIKEMSIVL